MTTQEAIKIIEVAIAEVEWNYPLDYAIAFEKAIEALKVIETLKEKKQVSGADEKNKYKG